jgi:hypothetical protein
MDTEEDKKSSLVDLVGIAGWTGCVSANGMYRHLTKLARHTYRSREASSFRRKTNF